jgi:hypothetical protein
MSTAFAPIPIVEEPFDLQNEMARHLEVAKELLLAGSLTDCYTCVLYGPKIVAIVPIEDQQEMAESRKSVRNLIKKAPFTAGILTSAVYITYSNNPAPEEIKQAICVEGKDGKSQFTLLQEFSADSNGSILFRPVEERKQTSAGWFRGCKFI